MFKIYDGRDRFYQWDLDRQIIVNDPDINQIHFCNRTDSCSLVSEVKTIDGLRIANVPNILLQEDWKIKVYAYDHNYTKHCATYEVEKRSKPADYIYTETEVFQYEQLVERMDGIDNTIEDRVNDYLTANPPKADLEGYATEDYVNEQIGNIEFPETDLTGYATTEYVDKAVEDVEVDLTGYATEQYVQDEIGKIPETDLSNYYTKSETNNLIPQVALTRNGTGAYGGTSTSAANNNSFAYGYYAKAEGSNSFAIGHQTQAKGNDQTVIGKYNATDTTSVLIIGNGHTTRSNAMTVDFNGNVWAAGEITVGADKKKLITADDIPEIPDTTGLATEKYVDDAIAGIEHPTTDLSNYYTKSEVDTAIENIDIPETDLSNYYNKSEVDELIENIDVGGGSGGDVVSVEEVYVGTTQPTDENIKLWVNPDEQESFATLSEVDTKIANAIAAIVDGEEVAY